MSCTQACRAQAATRQSNNVLHKAMIGTASVAPVKRIPIARRAARRVAASSSNNGGPPPPQQPAPAESSIADSDVVFLLKLVGVSFALGGAIKYGSLLVDLPFEPSIAAALAIVLAPPLVWSALKLGEGK